MKELTLTGAAFPTRGVPHAECVAVPFLGGHIPAVMIDGEPYVVPKPIVDLLGITWAPQHTKLSAARWAIISLVVTQLPNDFQPRQHVAITLETFSIWLAGIQEGRVAPEAQETVIHYKREAGKALRDHFFGKPAQRELSRKDMALMILAAEEELERAHLQIKADKPKVEVFNAWFDPENAVETTDFAKRLGLRSAQELNKRMQQCGIVRKDTNPRTGHSRNLPTADWGHCFKVVPTRIPTGGFVDVAWILPEGQLEIVEELRNHGLIDV